jgi:Ca-activated chloride channel homolog
MNFRLLPRLLGALGAFAALASGSAAAFGQGLIVPERPIRIQPFYVKNLKVSTTISDNVAETSVEQTFVNNSSVEQEGTYLYPLPEGAMPSAFSMTVGDRTYEPKVLTKEEARTIYEGIVRRRQDPALLEYVGRNLVQVRVYPIPARGERVIRMRYTELIKPSGGVRRYAYPLSTSRFGARPVGISSVTIKLKASKPLKNVYSPSHDVAVRRPDEFSAVASWEGINDMSDRDLALFYSMSEDDIGLSLLTYRTDGRDGYFMLLASPRVTIPKARVLPKQVLFVFDRTGSMAGEKIQQAKKSLVYCLNKLNPQDRFSVITFSDEPEYLFKQLQPATQENVRKAVQYAESMEASGGTNIDSALRSALTTMRQEDGGQKMVVFMTDGLPTVGETNVETILRHVQDLNNSGRIAANPKPQNGVRAAGLQDEGGRANPNVGAKSRIFSFGVGYDVNIPFLDRLGEIGRGDTDYVKPAEDVEVKVSAFFARVASPVLSDVRLAFDGVDVYDVFPKTYPDLFKDSQLVITGRFRNAAGAKIRLSGMANNAQESFRLSSDFRESDMGNSFLPRIWAARKIGWLSDQLRLASLNPNPVNNKEVVDEIIRLSREYGIITEYTSFLVDDREQARLGVSAPAFLNRVALEDEVKLREEVSKRARQYGVSGENAANQSLRGKDLGKADKAVARNQAQSGGVYYSLGAKGEANEPADLYAAPGNFQGGQYSGGFGGMMGGRSANREALRGPAGPSGSALTVGVQNVADRTFFRTKENVWQDQSFDEKKQKLMTIKAFSDAHFALLRAVPQMGVYSSVGEDAIIRLGRNAVRIGKTGRESLSAAEVKDLVAK